MNGPMLYIRPKIPSDIDITGPLSAFIKKQYGEGQLATLKPYLHFSHHHRHICQCASFILKPSEKLLDDHFFAYILLLEHASRHFPIDSGSIVQFKWLDQINKQKLQTPKTPIEIACVLFNAASAFQHMGRDKLLEGDPKNAMRHYQLAAGLFDASADRLKGFNELPPDTNAELFRVLSLAMMACAQHCAYEVGLREGKMAAPVLSKMAAEGAAMYAATAIKLNELSHSLHGGVDKVWIRCAEYHRILMDTRGHWHFAVDRYSDKEVGEALTHLNKCNKLLKDIAKLAKDLGSDFTAAVTKFQTFIGGLHADYTKDNEKVYHQKVKDFNELPPLPRLGRCPIKPITMDQIAYFQTGIADPFTNIVPPQVIQAVAQFKDEMSHILTTAITGLHSKRSLMKDSLIQSGAIGVTTASVRAPDGGLLKGISPGLRTKIQTIQEQLRGAPPKKKLQDDFHTLRNVSMSCRDKITGLVDKVLAEQENDRLNRIKYGSKWEIPPSESGNRELLEALRQLQDRMAAAAAADDVVLKKLDQADVVNELMKQISQIEIELTQDGVASYGPEQDKLLEALTSLVTAFEANSAEEASGVSDLRQVLETDSKVLFERLQKEPMEKFGQIIQTSKDSILQQIQVLEQNSKKGESIYQQALQAHNSITQARQLQNNEAAQRVQKREQRISVFEQACSKFSEIHGNIQEGLNFWGVTTETVDVARERTDSWLVARALLTQDLMDVLGKETEAEQQLKATLDLIHDMQMKGEIQKPKPK